MAILHRSRLWVRKFRHRRHFLGVERDLKKRLKKSNNGGLIIGPTNAANQATLWSKALSEAGLKSESLRISQDSDKDLYTTDYAVNADLRKNEKFVIDLAQQILEGKSGALLESLRPIFGFRRMGGYQLQNAIDDLRFVRKIGKKVGVVFHGSDIRDPEEHIKRNPYSPFRNNVEETRKLMESSKKARELLPALRKARIPIFVSTIDLLHEVPDATWLPIVVDVGKFDLIGTKFPVMTSQKLRVLYLPSRGWIKSSEVIQPILEKLNKEGIIDLVKEFSSGPVKSEDVPNLIAKSDLVIDQFLGVIGVLPLEALAAGRAVMTYVPDELRKNQSGYELPPVINVNPSNLEESIRNFANNPSFPTDGLEYVNKWHNGKLSVEKIRAVLEI